MSSLLTSCQPWRVKMLAIVLIVAVVTLAAGAATSVAATPSWDRGSPAHAHGIGPSLWSRPGSSFGWYGPAAGPAAPGPVLPSGAVAAPVGAAVNGWSVLPSPNPAAQNGQLLGISCATASECVAVGTRVRASGVSVPLALRRDGRTWSDQPVPSPAGSSVNGLAAVSCPSASECMAVGRAINHDGGYVPLAEIWNGSGWRILPTPTAPAAPNSYLNGVACTSPSVCIAVGGVTARTGFGAHGTLAERWNGTAWSITATPNIAQSFLNFVACTSPSACTAVGFGGGGSLAERWNGAEWAVQPTPNPAGAGGVSFLAVACPSRSACVAVGNYFTDSGRGMTLAEHWNGNRWRIAPTPDTGGQLSILWGLACVSVSDCTATGNSDAQTLAERWDGTQWSLESTPNPPGVPASALFAVDCPSSSACQAVGTTGPQTLAEGRTGSRWRIENSPAEVGAQASQLAAVACTSPSACTAVGGKVSYSGGFVAPSGNPLGTLAERWNGTAWRLVPTPDPAGAAGAFLTGVACPRSSTCMAVGGSFTIQGNPTGTLAERWSGSAWSIVPTPDPGGAHGGLLTAVACTTPSRCVAVGFETDSSGVPGVPLAELWDGRMWRIVPTASPGASAVLSGVACTSASACVAVGNTTNDQGVPTGTLAELWDGATWSIVPTLNPDGSPDSGLIAVSCASRSSCLAVGGAGDSVGNPTGTLVERWDGTSWTIVQTPSNPGGTNSSLSGVACPSSTDCTIVGLGFPPDGPVTLAERWNGTTLSIHSTPRIPGAYDLAPPGVACPTLSTCSTVGGYTNNGPTLTLTERLTASQQSDAYPTG